MFLWFAYLTKYFPTIQSFQLFLILIGDNRFWLIQRNLYFENWSICFWPLFCPCCWWCKVSLFVEFRFKYLLRIRAVDIPAGVPSKVCRANFWSNYVIYIICIYSNHNILMFTENKGDWYLTPCQMVLIFCPTLNFSHFMLIIGILRCF